MTCSTSATEGLDGAITTPRSELASIPVTPDAAWADDDGGAPASNAASMTATAGVSDAFAALNSGGPNGRGSRWRSLLFLANSAYQGPSTAHATQGASSLLTPSTGAHVQDHFSPGSPGSGSSANTAIGRGLIGVAQPTFYHLHEKFSNQRRSLLFKGGSLHSDAKALTTWRLKLDAYDSLAKAYITLHRIHQINWTTSHTPSKYLKRSGESSSARIGASESLTTSAMVLLEPLRVYVTALSKATETMTVQSHLEGGALETLRQLIHAVRMHQVSVNRILTAVWVEPCDSSQEVAKGEESRPLQRNNFPKVGRFESNLNQVFGSDPFSAFLS